MKEIERLIKIRHDVIIASIIQYSSGGVVCIAMEGELMDKLKLPPSHVDFLFWHQSMHLGQGVAIGFKTVMYDKFL